MPASVSPEALPRLMPAKGDDRLRPLPEVGVLDMATATVDDVVENLIRAGGCVVRNVLDADVLAQIERETRPYIDADGAWEGSFFPKETRRVMGLAGKSKAFTKNMIGNKLFQGVSDRMLTSTFTSWYGQEVKTSVSRPQVNNTIIFSINTGARDQELHRDDMIHHNMPRSKMVEEYEIGQDTGIGFFVAGKKTTKTNGATRFIPGSHLWGSSTPPDESLAFYAELEPGDGFVFLSSCFHGGSANKTVDEERLVYSFFMTKGFLRQEENQYLASNFADLASMYDDDLLETLGYSLSAPFLGWVDLKHPLDALRDTDTARDLF